MDGETLMRTLLDKICKIPMQVKTINRQKINSELNSLGNSIGLMRYSNLSIDDFFEGIVKASRGLGFDLCIYLVGIRNEKKDSWQYQIKSNISKSFQNKYLFQSVCLNPLLKKSSGVQRAFVWDSDIFSEIPSIEIRQKVQLVGLGEGLSMRLFESPNSIAQFTVARSEGTITSDELAAKINDFSWLAYVTQANLYRYFLEDLLALSNVKLTDRERQFIKLTADGNNAAEIAAKLGVVERTVNFHLGNVLAKLAANNKTHAVAVAMRLGLVD